MRTIEISIREILIYILYKWIPILLCAVFVAVLMGGYSYTKIPQGTKLAQIEQDNRLSVEKEKAAIEGLTEEIAYKQAEIDKYIAAGNFTNGKIATIKADISFNPSEAKISAIRSRYSAMFRSMSLKTNLSSILPVEYDEDTLRRTIKFSIQSSAESPNTVSISAMGGDELNPRVIVEAIYDYYVNKLEDTIGRTSPHTFEMVSSIVTDAVEGETLFDEEIQKLKKQINSLQAEIRAKNDNIRKLDNQMKTETSLKGVAVSAITGAATGGVVGMFAVLLTYLVKVPVITPEQIQKRLGIRYIGGTHHKKRYGFSILADKIAGRYLTFSTKAEAADYIGTSLREKINHGSLLITGSLTRTELEALSKALFSAGALNENITLLVAPDVTTSADSVRVLSQSDYVILAERIGKSTLKRVIWQSERIAISGKELLGYVLY